ncbi:uncharacterized protein LOC107037337 [Diachasma alloeum]|uniref:uncharacterized protein LOC107037337 n=1 Tax=Diachasma alloeum TaxID=454923 RepID=UPI0007384C51|nr:uncharacterized protein LOC107037337 [Diachasma alloeum]
METVTHLWNLTNALVKTESPGANNLRNHYIQCCRDLSDKVELPKNNFGPGTMCSHCGTLWRPVNTTVRINKSRNHSRGIRKLIRRRADDDSSLSNFKRKLLDKCVKNRNNELAITCSVCHERTTISLAKPKREKLKIEHFGEGKLQQGLFKKKKKRKSRDKTAGLIINTPTNSVTSKRSSTNGDEKSTAHTPQKSQVNKFNRKAQPQGITPVHQPKRINISKLKAMIDTTMTPAKRTSLHAFLTELC